MKRMMKTLAAWGLCGGLGCLLLTGCSSSNKGMSDADERKIFNGDASKMPPAAQQQMNAAMQKGKAGAKMPSPSNP